MINRPFFAYSSIRGQLTKPINKLLKQIVSKCYELCTIPSFHPTEQGTEQRPRPRARNTQIDQNWIYFSPQRNKTKQKPGEVSVVWANLGLWLHTISLLTADSLKEHRTSDFDIKNHNESPDMFKLDQTGAALAPRVSGQRRLFS